MINPEVWQGGCFDKRLGETTHWYGCMMRRRQIAGGRWTYKVAQATAMEEDRNGGEGDVSTTT